MTGPAAHAAGDTAPYEERCAVMQLHQPMADAIGYSLKRMKFDDVDIGDSIVVTEPRMAGLRGPNITLLGRDVRLAVTRWQTSPQELWQKGTWGKVRVTQPCQRQPMTWSRSWRRGVYGKFTLDHEMGFTNYYPTFLYRTRLVADALAVRPYGFSFGASVGMLLDTNTYTLLYLNDPRKPVRRDMEKFSERGGGLDRLFASWHGTPVNDVHVGITGGYLEEMYAGIGAEAVWRPWGSPFWLGGDAWEAWRRDPSFFNLHITGDHVFTGHVRAGYDLPNTRTSFYAAAGRYLAGDTGATVGMYHDFENGARLDAMLTWTGREEYQGFFRDTHFDPMLRVVFPIGKNKKAEQKAVNFTLRQMGRDGGQMLNRPMPLEQMTEPFSTREVVRQWPSLLDGGKKIPYSQQYIDDKEDPPTPDMKKAPKKRPPIRAAFKSR